MRYEVERTCSRGGGKGGGGEGRWTILGGGGGRRALAVVVVVGSFKILNRSRTSPSVDSPSETA